MPAYPYHALPLARDLVDRAWSSLDPQPAATDTQRSAVVRLMCAMYLLNGSVGFCRGYVSAIRERMEAAGMRPPPSHSLRWYRSRLSEDPGEFLTVPGVDRGVLDAIAARYGR